MNRYTQIVKNFYKTYLQIDNPTVDQLNEGIKYLQQKEAIPEPAFDLITEIELNLPEPFYDEILIVKEANLETYTLLGIIYDYYRLKFPELSEEEILTRVNETSLKKVAKSALYKSTHVHSRLLAKCQAMFEAWKYGRSPIWTQKHFMEKEEWNQIYLYQNLSSLGFVLDSLRMPNPQTLFVKGILNQFQTLKTDQKKQTIYSCETQAFTIYALRCLAHRNIIKILKEKKIQSEEINDLKKAYGTKEIDSHLDQMYDISFQKLRDLTEEDLPFINSLLKCLKVEEQFICCPMGKKLYFDLPKNQQRTLTSFEENQKILTILRLYMQNLKETLSDINFERKYREIQLILEKKEN